MWLRLSLIVLLALGLSGFATVGWMALQPAPVPTTIAVHLPPPPPPPPMTELLTLAQAEAPGTLVDPSMLGVTTVPTAHVPPDAYPATPAARRELNGAMVRRRFLPGQPIERPDVLPPGDRGFLAAILRPGFLAETVPVDATSGVGGLIWPGDHVEVILTRTEGGQDVTPACRSAAVVLFEDVRVVAIDRRLTEGGAPAGREEMGHTATLEVSPAQAERLALATRLGEIGLAVRAAMAGPAAKSAPLSVPGPCASRAEGQAPLWASDVMPRADVKPHLTVFEGNDKPVEYTP